MGFWPIFIPGGGAPAMRINRENSLQRRFTDFLPVVLPTEDKVDEMLKGTSRRPEEILGRMGPTAGVFETWTYTVRDAAVNAAVSAAESAVAAAESQIESIKILYDKVDAQEKKTATALEQILSEIREIKQTQPNEFKAILETLKNIPAERAALAQQREELRRSELPEADLRAQERILELKDKKLQKNYDELGKTISKSAKDMDEAVDALDQIDLQ